jgi:hypothetical protein
VSTRDGFSKEVVVTVGKRANYACSNPECHATTTGPHSRTDRSVNIGVAAHMTAAARGGPRYDASLTPEVRSSAENGIWLCQNCAKKADSDPERFPVVLLQEWKFRVEAAADLTMGHAASGVTGRAPHDEIERARLRDERVQRILKDWPRSGNAAQVIDTYADLSREQKAELYDTAYALYKRGRRPERNPFRG